MLKFDHVNVTIGKNRVLRDVCLTVEKGCITALLGKNGSGKSTLLRCVSGIHRYDGRIWLDEQLLSTFSPNERAKRIACLPQILPETDLTVRQLCLLGRNPYGGMWGKYTAGDLEAAEHAIKRMCVERYADRPCCTLSGGEKQRAFLALLLTQGSEILLLDEPGTYLDMDARQDLYALLRQLRDEENKTVLCVMHEVSDAVQLADRIGLMDSGRCVFEGAKETCLEQGMIENILGLHKYVCKRENGTEVFFR